MTPKLFQGIIQFMILGMESKRCYKFRFGQLIYREARQAEFESLGYENPKAEALEEYPHWLYWGYREYLQWILLNILYRENNYVSRF